MPVSIWHHSASYLQQWDNGACMIPLPAPTAPPLPPTIFCCQLCYPLLQGQLPSYPPMHSPNHTLE